MAHRNPRQSFASLGLAAALGAVAVGCGPSKTVLLRTTPPGATLFVYKVTPQGAETPVPLDGDQGKSPATLGLAFDNDVHYRVEAHRVLCAPVTDTQVRLEPLSQTTYEVALVQFKQFVDALGYNAQRAGDLWRVRRAVTPTVATIDTAEPSPAFVDQPVPVTDNKQANVDFPSFAVTTGATGTLMVYQQVTNDADNGRFDSRLFKLPLTGGVTATALTMNRDQQPHNPTFSYTGDQVIFDTANDSRTQAPAQFRTTTDGSTIERLGHDSDTCEVEFSAGRDALAFTAYSPNAAGPQVMVSARDGSGPTPRATGMSPQVSPDGNRIVYVHPPENGGHLRLATVNVHGPITTGELQLDTEHDALDPHWSPDGKLIAYCSNQREGQPVDLSREPDARFREGDETHSFLWLVTADGRGATQLTHGESFDSHPVFDPDGRTVYFRSNRGGTWNIWKCRLSDAAMAKLGVGR